jgi:hypothetical protein
VKLGLKTLERVSGAVAMSRKPPVPVPDPGARREFKRSVTLGLALFAAGVLALIYVRTL